MRRVAFRLVAMTLVPALLFGVVELALRGFGYGYPTGFFRKVPGHDAYEGNPTFGWRYFPRRLTRDPALIRMPATKAPGTCRIFVLGGSAAMGVPDQAYSFGRILEVMLSEAYPDTRFEVFNAAMTAINSHTLVDIAGDCAAHRPDVFVVYMGNNEVVGPYGPGTAFQKSFPSRTIIRTALWLRKTRTVQLVENALRSGAREDNQLGEWRGMELFLENPVSADDPSLEIVYANFRANLEDICAAARRAGANVVAGTVAVNLRNCAPFLSVHRPDLANAEKAAWDAAYQAGIAHEESADFARAVERYSAAEKIDSHFAALHYRLGRCLLRLKKIAEADQHFSLARDRDALRFRADSRINNTIREAASERESQGVWLVDAERALHQDITDGTPPAPLFFEHVHLTFEGNYQLARAFFPEVVAAFPAQVRSGGPVRPQPAPPSRCAERLVLTDYDRAVLLTRALELTAVPPFTGQLDYARQRADLTERFRQLAPCLHPDALSAAAATYAQAVDRNPHDLHLRFNFARLETRRSKYENAIKQLRVVLTYLPENFKAWQQVGTLLAKQGKMGEARTFLDASLEKTSRPVEAAITIGKALDEEGRLEEAVRYYRKALAISPRFAQALCNLGSALSRLGRHSEALAALRKADELMPNQIEVTSQLAVALSRSGDDEESARQFARILENDPSDAKAQIDLARALVRLGRSDDALRHYTEAVALDPDNLETRLEHANFMASVGRSRQALTLFRDLLTRRRGWPPALAGLAWILATASDPTLRNPSEAVRYAEAACSATRYELPEALNVLAAAYAAADRSDQAISAAKKAIQIAEAAGNKSLAAQIRARLEQYQREGTYESAPSQ